MNKNKLNARGVNGLELVTAALVVLKLCDVIDWPWLWVLAPTWVPISGALLLLGVVFAVEVIAKKNNQNRNKT